MEHFYRPTWVEISLDALEHNLQQFRQALPADVRIMTVIKADAYGHGALEVAREAARAGIDYLGVAFLDEALNLRQAGVKTPILVLGYTPPEGIELALQHSITLNVYSNDLLDALENMDTKGGYVESDPLKIHIKVDTGMARLGLHEKAEAVAFIERAMSIPNVEVEGLFTHYACADELDKKYTHKQHAKFQEVVDYFDAKGVTFPLLHAGNSATGIDVPELTHNMVRLGIGMYGMYPSEEVNKERIALKPVLSLKTTIVNLQTLPPNSAVSYGSIYQTTDYERIATVPIGYADGYSRMLSTKAEALVHGERRPVVGRICMDQCMLQVDGLANVKLGDEVVLIGSQGDERISAEDIAALLGTINYEVVCMMSHRVPRVYTRGGKEIKVINSLQVERLTAVEIVE
ncbi:alanine racemase [Paenibacillus sp. N1-5-1-14]|uniref:alanine racemase n=1 Tax=Paenibacillus radicibacter TaxID=2972488 RepID=UPI002158B552|nr:alanine racemase [Paenibacillus radicibacter]MCR8643620.1 alanine racemase [Paenibacillus radicibacter]